MAGMHLRLTFDNHKNRLTSLYMLTRTAQQDIHEYRNNNGAAFTIITYYVNDDCAE